MKRPDQPVTISFERNGQRVQLTIRPDQWRVRNGVSCVAPIPDREGTEQVFVKLLAATAVAIPVLNQVAIDGAAKVIAVVKLPQTAADLSQSPAVCLISEHLPGQEFAKLERSDWKSLVAESHQNVRLETLFAAAIYSVAASIRALNEQGLFYPDLTPENLMVDKQNGGVWLIDLDSCVQLNSTLAGGFSESFSVLAANKLLPESRKLLDRFRLSGRRHATAARSQASVVSFVLYLLLTYSRIKQADTAGLRISLEGTPWQDRNYRSLLGFEQKMLKRMLLIPSESLPAVLEKVQRWRKSLKAGSAGNWDYCMELLKILSLSCLEKMPAPSFRRPADEWLRTVSIDLGNRLSLDDVIERWPVELDLHRDRLPIDEFAECFEEIMNLRKARDSRDYLEAWLTDWTAAAGSAVKEAIAHKVCGEDGVESQSALHRSCRRTVPILKRCQEVQRWWAEFTRLREAVTKAARLFASGDIREARQTVEKFRKQRQQYPLLDDLLQAESREANGWYSHDLLRRISEARQECHFLEIRRLTQLIPRGNQSLAVCNETTQILQNHQRVLDRGFECIEARDFTGALQQFQQAFAMVSDSSAARVGVAAAEFRQLVAKAALQNASAARTNSEIVGN